MERYRNDQLKLRRIENHVIGPSPFPCPAILLQFLQLPPDEHEHVPNTYQGMEHVDVYFFPDPAKGNAAGQMAEMVNYLVRMWVLVGKRSTVPTTVAWLCQA